MQFMVYDPNYDPQKAGPPPSPEFMAEMGQFIRARWARGMFQSPS